MSETVSRVPIACRVNGEPRKVQAFPMARLLDVIREEMHLTGTKEGCGEGECGACSVLLNGAIVNSCLVPAIDADGADIRTIEGVADGEPVERRAERIPRMWRRAVRHLHAGNGDGRCSAAGKTSASERR